MTSAFAATGPSRLVALALVLVASLVVVAGPATAGASRVHNCGGIAFERNSEFGAYNIRSRGVGCKTARSIAKASRDLSVTRGPYTYGHRGFRCRGRAHNQTLPSVDWRCTRGRKIVRFGRS